MRELNFAGLTDDGALRLTSSDGTQYSLVVDDRLNAAVRGDRPRLGQLSIAMSGATPRDIQTRVRHGHSPEDIAATTGLPLDHVERFAGPPLAERAHVAELARAARIRSSPDSADLGTLLLIALAEAGVHDDAVGWDAWREEDDTWTLQASWARGEQTVATTAHWSYDATARAVSPRDATAAALHATFAPDEVAEHVAGPDDDAADIEDQDGEYETPPVLRVIGGSADAAGELPPPAHGWGDDADPDAALTSVVDRYSGDVVDISGRPDEPDTALEDLLNTSPGIPREKRAPRGKRTTEADKPRAESRSRKRAAVPTWDEILFGSKSPDQG